MRYGTVAANPNRESFFRGLGADPAAVLGLELRHTRRVLFPADAAEHRRLSEAAALEGGADGLLLPRGSGLFASITVADCMPIWILDRASGAYGVLHSGWKGTGILAAAARLLESRLGSPASALAVVLGPSIGPCCYGVPEDRAESFASEFGPESVPLLAGRRRIDLRTANIALARSLGVGALLSIDSCTSCDPRLGSYRREGPASFTRMVAAIGPFPAEAA
jgi:copper oxidase (laccase) domain-containing protein